MLLLTTQAESFRMHTEEATNESMTEEDIGIDMRGGMGIGVGNDDIEEGFGSAASKSAKNF